ncbi:MAG TPA: TetR/AcrR family transcriptional regulator [Nocardioides sp.]|nr:TetR/AcrR family transcriptional regulator [uncultured Nocardioides sp.]HEX5988035.1 TetR/AcrR family transcriptional regulator [Nocardioides sp.]
MSSTRVNRRLEQPRERVLAATLEMIAEGGLSALTMAALGKRLGTSGGHLLYYFGTKDKLLLETLRWSEDSYTEQRGAIAAGTADLAESLDAFFDLYLPQHPADPRWLLWLELWARAPYDAELAAGEWELEQPWRADLHRILTRCLGEERAREITESTWVDGTIAMLDGFAIAVVTGAPIERKYAQQVLHERALQLT